MAISFGGWTASGDEVRSVAWLGAETRITQASLTQDMIEDLQFFDFLGRAQLLGAAGALESCERVTNDPPDLKVKLAGLPVLGVELTSLSSTDISRQRLGEMRSIERALNERLLNEADKYPHLRGRYVCINEMAGDATRPQRRTGLAFTQFIDQFMVVLGEDFGVVDTTPLMKHAGPDGTIPGEIAMKGRKFFAEQDYLVEVKAADDQNAPPIVRANCQIDISLNDLRARLINSVEAKDRTENDILLITTQLPDRLGYRVIGDMFVAQVVEQIARSDLALQPTHLDQVIFHCWQANAIILYERPGAPKLVDSSIWPPLVTSGTPT